ncbi:MAG: tRNA uridine-5-carboxymethylaminomethyl(34) synthesis enzyme MnmG [Clostridiales bacterium]|nr:tRNA uridine-5-carboxymethylaminomethyl(34) synthesis enzyme MnmG [Clostridiales bacterium]
MESWDVAVVGGGHAGCEAALAAARMGMKTILFAIQLDSVAMMPCNPNIGGASKGHIVREIDALGGQMGKNIDKTFLQSRMLNVSKGPAVHSLRAQADKFRYAREMKKTLEQTANLTIRQSEIYALQTESSQDNGSVTGVVSESGAFYACKTVILCAGTYLKARCLYGETILNSGPAGFRASRALSESLQSMGITLLRFKTGTSARVHKNTIDFSRMERQNGDEPPVPFSFETDPAALRRKQLPCYLTYTNEDTHKIIRENLCRSPMYSGVIKAAGARYCPSIEDKVVRFADKKRHQVFLEPEGEDTAEMYVAGMSTSLPEDVQEAIYRTLPGMENCRIMRNGYAIEYDCIDAAQLKLSLEFKRWSGLFSAGQQNGSSGYEEAAAQGLAAGINAARFVQGKPPLIIDRSEGYIGVLIDDLTVKGTNEPYRMMTSRAEYRLLLRQDNADARLMPKGYEMGLISSKRYDDFLLKMRQIETEISRVRKMILPPSEAFNKFLAEHASPPIDSGAAMPEMIKRPELSYDLLRGFDPDRPGLPAPAGEQVNLQLKYEGYIRRQMMQVEQFKKLESRLLPMDIDYSSITGLRLEARSKLDKLRPVSLGQASRVPGVTPADISVLLIYLAAHG